MSKNQTIDPKAVEENNKEFDNQPQAGSDDLKKELVVAQKKAEEYLDGWKRAKADYLNLKKDSEKRQEELVKFANAALIMSLLPILDHFRRAFDHLPADQKDSDWVKGIAQIKKQLEDLLLALEIKPMKAVGEKFDPLYHEAVAHEKKEGFEADKIIEEIETGYLIHDKILKPAKVKVAS